MQPPLEHEMSSVIRKIERWISIHIGADMLSTWLIVVVTECCFHCSFVLFYKFEEASVQHRHLAGLIFRNVVAASSVETNRRPFVYTKATGTSATKSIES